jgi:hypothetical protein
MDLILDEHPQSEEEVQLKRVPSDRFASALPCVKPLVPVRRINRCLNALTR